MDSVVPADTNGRPARGRLADIEVPRGIAVLMVMSTHLVGVLITWPVPFATHIVNNYAQFWPGVDLFLAISGFVIGRSLLPRLRTAETSLGFAGEVALFWTRRAWRLMPAAWL